jgi:SNF2 family DNA or RNA helicase
MLELLPYQRVGVDTLKENSRFLLADDMGLGKTPQLICAVEEQSKDCTVLVVCPNTIKWNWAIEIGRWTKATHTVDIVDGSTNEKKAKSFYSFVANKKTQGIHYLIINYESLPFWIDVLRVDWDFIIVDEAHRIKNRKTTTTEMVHLLSMYTSHLYFATGTPFLNTTTDIYSILKCIDKKEFRSYWTFVHNYCDVEVDYKGHKHYTVADTIDPDCRKSRELKRVLEKYMLRRLKTEVRKDLPAKINIPIYLHIEDEQRRIYDEMETQMCSLIDGVYHAGSLTIAQITKLLQICISPQLLSEKYKTIEGAKIEAFKELLEAMPDEKITVFSQWESVTSAIKEHLKKWKYKYKVEEITGKVTGKERQEGIERFQSEPTSKMMLCTISAGGVGVTLTASHNVIFFDKSPVPALNLQAEDRSCRHGQDFPVNVYSLITLDTLEEDLYRLLEKKSTAIGVNLGEVEEVEDSVIAELKKAVLTRRFREIK